MSSESALLPIINFVCKLYGKSESANGDDRVENYIWPQVPVVVLLPLVDDHSTDSCDGNFANRILNDEDDDDAVDFLA